ELIAEKGKPSSGFSVSIGKSRFGTSRNPLRVHVRSCGSRVGMTDAGDPRRDRPETSPIPARVTASPAAEFLTDDRLLRRYGVQSLSRCGVQIAFQQIAQRAQRPVGLGP